jgi:nitrate/TMAO reductase-like tetraheme cytochrome c subunit
VVVFVIVVGAVLITPVVATTSLSYCSSCKVPKAAEASWQRSVHSKVACNQCHVAPGLAGQVKWRTREWVNIWAQYLNVPRTASVGTRPGNANCLRCHPLDKIPDQGNGVRMSHETHVNMRGLVCADCHTNVSHASPGASNAVSMTLCPMCHNSQGAPNDCAFCHLTPPSAATHAKDYLATHGRDALLNRADCLRCHHDPKTFCDGCHSFPPADHFSGRWRYTHGPAATADPQVCYGCHVSKTFCAQCHQVTHPADWLKTHGAVSDKGPSACLVCHPQGMCDACHVASGVSP